jgi:hypothetical protein
MASQPKSDPERVATAIALSVFSDSYTSLVTTIRLPH